MVINERLGCAIKGRISASEVEVAMKGRLLVAGILILLVCGCGRKSKEQVYAEGIKELSGGNANAAVVLFKSALEKDQNYLDARYQLAKAYNALAKFDQAEKEYQKVLLQNPARDEIRLALAQLYNTTRKPDQAIKMAEEYLTAHRDDPEALEAIGSSKALLKEYGEAERYFLRVLQARPERVKTQLELAAVVLTQGRSAESRRLLEKVIASDPGNSKAQYIMASLEVQEGNKAKALEIYKSIARQNPNDALASYKAGVILLDTGDLDGVDRLASELIQKFPKSSDGYRLKGLVQYQKKNYAEAIASLQNSIKMSPTIEGYYFLGLSHFQRGELESALSQFRTILDRLPSANQARLMTGLVLLTQKRTDDGIVEIKKVLTEDDGNAVAHNLLGSAYMARGLYDEGMRELNRATELDPKLVEAHLKKGAFLFSKGKTQQAETELVTAVRANPDLLNTRLILATYYQRQRNSAKALATLKEGLTGKPSDAPLYTSIAGLCFGEGRDAEAVSALNKAKTINPTFTAAYANLATYYLAKGSSEKAVAEYEALLKADSSNLKAMLSLAVLHELRGRDREALALYERSLISRAPIAYQALAGYYVKKREFTKALKVLDEADKGGKVALELQEMKAQILLVDKKYKEALKVYDQMETQFPDRAATLKANAYVLMQDIPRALEQGMHLVSRHPSSANGYLVIAGVYESQKDYGRAVAEVKNGLRVDGKNLQALLALGNLEAGRKDYGRAMAAYEEAVRKDPDYIPAIFAQGTIYEKTGRKNEAVAIYRRILMKSATFVPALNNLAYLYVDGLGNKQEALRLALTAFKLEPRNVGVMDTLGYALLKNGRPGDAIPLLEKVAAAMPGNPTVNYHLAMAYRDAGEKPNALKSIERSLSLGPFPEQDSAKTLLAELRR